MVEGSATTGFTKADELYRGLDRTFSTLTTGHTHFRVKAVGGVLTRDSPWSNIVVDVALPQPLSGPDLGNNFTLRRWAYRGKLPAPALQASSGGLTWTAIKGSSRYVLERADNPRFDGATTIYEGRNRIIRTGCSIWVACTTE